HWQHYPIMYTLRINIIIIAKLYATSLQADTIRKRKCKAKCVIESNEKTGESETASLTGKRSKQKRSIGRYGPKRAMKPTLNSAAKSIWPIAITAIGECSKCNSAHWQRQHWAATACAVELIKEHPALTSLVIIQ